MHYSSLFRIAEISVPRKSYDVTLVVVLRIALLEIEGSAGNDRNGTTFMRSALADN